MLGCACVRGILGAVRGMYAMIANLRLSSSFQQSNTPSPMIWSFTSHPGPFRWEAYLLITVKTGFLLWRKMVSPYLSSLENWQHGNVLVIPSILSLSPEWTESRLLCLFFLLPDQCNCFEPQSCCPPDTGWQPHWVETIQPCHRRASNRLPCHWRSSTSWRTHTPELDDFIAFLTVSPFGCCNISIDPLHVTSRGARGGPHWRTAGAVCYGEIVHRPPLPLVSKERRNHFFL